MRDRDKSIAVFYFTDDGEVEDDLAGDVFERKVGAVFLAVDVEDTEEDAVGTTAVGGVDARPPLAEGVLLALADTLPAQTRDDNEGPALGEAEHVGFAGDFPALDVLEGFIEGS